MSIFKKLASPLIAIALVAVMGVSLISAPQRTAYAVVTMPMMVVGTLVAPTPATVLANNAGTVTMLTTGAYSTGGKGGTAGTATTITLAAGADAGVEASTGIVLTETAAGSFPIDAKTLIFVLPTGFQYTSSGICTITGAGAATGPNCKMSLNDTATEMTLTIGGGVSDAISNATAGVYTVSGTKVRATGNTIPTVMQYIELKATSTNVKAIADVANNDLNLAVPATKTFIPLPAGFGGWKVGTIAVPAAYAAAAAPYTIHLQMTKDSTACGTANPVSLSGVPNAAGVPNVTADGSLQYRLCASVMGASGKVVPNMPVTFTSSMGVIGTAAAKTGIAITNSAGNASIDYRGAGSVAVTDTVIASNTTITAVGTMSVNLIAAAGSTATKVAFVGPANTAIAATINNSTPNYISQTFGTNIAVSVTDASAVGVNDQVVLISTDRGGLTAGFNASCSTTKAITGTTVTGSQTVGGTEVAGTVKLTYCANQADAAGKATITVENISTAMAKGTSTISHAGRPAKITATATGNAIAVSVVDAGGNNVADGTPVRFTLSTSAGAVSSSCTTTTDGKATSVVALIAATGTVLVSTDWNESGTSAAGCAAASASSFAPVNTGVSGGSQLAASVTVPGGTATTGGATGAAVAGAGTFVAPPVYSASKLAQSVFNGGTVAQLDTAITAAKGSGAWAQDSKGVFTLYIVNGGFVNDGFKAAFTTGFAGATALTVVGS